MLRKGDGIAKAWTYGSESGIAIVTRLDVQRREITIDGRTRRPYHGRSVRRRLTERIR